MPGMTLILSVFVKLFGQYPILEFQIFQSLLMTFGLYVLFLIGRKIFGSIPSVIGLILMTVYIPNIYVTGIMLTETVFSVLFFLLFLVAIHAIEEKKMKYYIAGGILLGLAVLLRPTILPYPAVIFCVWLMKKYKVKEMLKFALPVILIVVTLLAPWWIRNAVIFNKFIPLTLASGNPMLQGTYINYDHSNDNLDYGTLVQKYNPDVDVTMYGKDELVDDEVETTMSEIRYKEVMSKEPFEYIKWYTVGKTIKNFEFPFLWEELFGVQMQTCVNWHVTMLIVAILGIITYIILNRKKQKPYFWMMLITILFFNCVHLPFYCFPRYVYPVINFFILACGYLIYIVAKAMLPLAKNAYAKYKSKKESK